MTTIAFDGRFVAADRLAGSHDMRYQRPVVKLLTDPRQPDVLFGLTGSFGYLQPMIDWFLAGAEPAAMPAYKDPCDSCLLVFCRSGQLSTYRLSMPYPENIGEPDAWGTGADFAIGAMDAGRCARDAVIIASRRDKHSGNGVLTYDLHTMSWIAENADTARIEGYPAAADVAA